MSDNPTYWQWRDEQYRAKLAACQETDHAFRTYHWTDPESAIRAVYARLFGAPAPDSWSDALAAVARAAGGQVLPYDPAERVAPLGEPGPAVLPAEEGM